MKPISETDSSSLSGMFAGVAAEIERALARCRSVDPTLSAKILAFTQEADASQLRAVFELRPAVFRVELLRMKGEEIEAMILAEHRADFDSQGPAGLH